MSGHVISHLSLLHLMAQSDITVPQQHGILDLVQGSSPLVQGVLYLLILFSVLSWGIIFYKSNQVRRAKRESEKFIEIFWDSRNLASIHDASRDLKAGPVAQVFRAGYEELLRVPRGKKEILATAGEPLSTELGGVDNVTRAAALRSPREKPAQPAPLSNRGSHRESRRDCGCPRKSR